MLQYIESITILYVQLGQTVDCGTHVHIAAKFEEMVKNVKVHKVLHCVATVSKAHHPMCAVVQPGTET